MTWRISANCDNRNPTRDWPNRARRPAVVSSTGRRVRNAQWIPRATCSVPLNSAASKPASDQPLRFGLGDRLALFSTLDRLSAPARGQVGRRGRIGASIAASQRVSARNDSHVTLEYPAGSAWAGIGKPDRPRRGHVAIAPDPCIDHGKPVIGFAADVDLLSVVELVYAWMGEPRATFDGEKAVSVWVETDNHPVAATSVTGTCGRIDASCAVAA